ncbi:YopX family protein [Bacillaceae bacterium]
MREIKFRVWHKPSKTMFDWEKVKNNTFRIVEDDQLSVMQYTGLKDRNGKEIYEGDIVSDEYGNVAPIEWVQEIAQFLVMYESEPQEIGEWCTNAFEVIGNIYENPELLEQTK